MALLVPALAAEMDGKAFPEILKELSGTAFLSEFVVVLGRAGRDEFDRARSLLEPLWIIWRNFGSTAPIVFGKKLCFFEFSFEVSIF